MATDHAIRLGMLVGNFQSLECLLRFYLRGVAAKAGTPHLGKPYFALALGEAVPIDEVTNYDTLGKLIQRYNDDLAQRDASLQIDGSVVNTRDLIAHGRVSASNQSLAELRILKFAQPAKGATHVHVVANELMSDAWFDAHIAIVRTQIERVARAYEAFAV